MVEKGINMKFVRIVNNEAVDVVSCDPSQMFHPDIAAEFQEVPDTVEYGWKIVDGIWMPESKVEIDSQIAATSLAAITVSPVEFKLLWTPMERATITSLKATDPIVADFYSIIDDPRLTFVNLSLASTQQAVDYLLSKLVEAAILTAEQATERREAILSGSFQ